MKLTDLTPEQTEAIEYLFSVTEGKKPEDTDPLTWYTHVQEWNLNHLHQQAKINRFQKIINDINVLPKADIDEIELLVKEKAEKNKPTPIDPVDSIAVDDVDAQAPKKAKK